MLHRCSSPSPRRPLTRPAPPSPRRSVPVHCSSSGNGSSSGLDFVTCTFIVDDIVLPTGVTKMKTLGGGGSQTLWGYQMAAGASPARVGLSAGVGDDISKEYGECLQYLQSFSVDTSALIPIPGFKTPRAWQLFEPDGLRTQVWRVPVTPELWKMLRPEFDTMPDHFKCANSFHLGMDPGNVASFSTTLGKLRRAADANFGLLSVEPYTHSNRTLSADELREMCSAGHIFSPNELEAQCMLGRPKDARPTTAPDLAEALYYVERLHAHGAEVVALRRGASGVVISSRQRGTALRVPACAETDVVDVTGCGNAMIGGLVRVLQERWLARMQGQGPDREEKCAFSEDDLIEAAVRGSVSASLMAEALGMPALPPIAYVEEAEKRAENLRRRVAQVAV